jgi:hypothetical protein
MDSVRLGRALGFGARAAAKTLVTAVDAATAPNPSATQKTQAATTTSERPATSPAAASGARVAQKTAQTVTQVRQTGEGLKAGSKRFGEAVWGPTVKLSGILWLEVTGVLFGIFALSATMGAWRLHGDMHETATNHDAHMHFLVAVGMAVLFGYFCISSFVTAGRRGRQR